MNYQEVAMDSAVLVAGASEHPLIDFDLTFGVQFVLFLLTLAIGNKFLFQPYLRLRASRQAGIEGARAEAEHMADEAKAKLADYETKLGGARERASTEARKIRGEASTYEREVTTKARASATEALEAAKQKVRSETEAARGQLLPQAQALAKQMAAKLLGREVA
jgi:F-type H+-transporting ATPase subunit b